MILPLAWIKHSKNLIAISRHIPIWLRRKDKSAYYLESTSTSKRSSNELGMNNIWEEIRKKLAFPVVHALALLRRYKNHANFVSTALTLADAAKLDKFYQPDQLGWFYTHVFELSTCDARTRQSPTEIHLPWKRYTQSVTQCQLPGQLNQYGTIY